MGVINDEPGYMLPNDDTERDRLDMVHEMFLVTTDRKLFLAPIGPSPQRVLDLCTGTGIWAIQFGDEFPSAEVIGNDLSPSQPTLVPPNEKFIVNDVEEDWGYENNPFDFVHARGLIFSIRDMQRLIQQAYNCAKPGGWVEFQDWDPMIYSEDGSTKGTSIEKYYVHTLAAYEKAGYCARVGPGLEEWFRQAGFVDIKVTKYRVPMGVWPKDKYYKTLGTWNLLQVEEAGFEAMAMVVLTRHENWSADEVRLLAAKTLSDAKNRAIHGLFDFYIVYGRKPE
ncbi:hypothetical protein VTN77DRAFT_5419 [Rasamsonia byssochlamydoides]|uniref:uncharacterized protein n=1 Tax=Rasamsonia byssochlamydoides TaxID=89139 RepID=UPI003744A975